MHKLKVICQLFAAVFLGLAAAWVLLAGVRADQITLDRGKYTQVSLDLPDLQPVVVATIPLAVSPPLIHSVVTVNPTNGYAYVLAYAHDSSSHYHITANLMIMSYTEVISSSISADYGGALAVDPNRGNMLMPVRGGVAVISGTEMIRVIAVDTTLTGRTIGVEPGSGYIYVDGYDWLRLCIPEYEWCGGIVWVIFNGASTRLNVGGLVHAIGVNPATGYAYVTGCTGGLMGSCYTDVISRAERVSRVQSFGEAIGINPNNGYVYIAEADQNRVHVISGTQVVETLATGTQPSAIGVNPRTGYIYIANAGSNSLTVISATQVITTCAVGPRPSAIGVNPESGYIYVANGGNDTLSVISGTQVIRTLTVGHAPGAIGVNSNAGYIYVVNHDDASVSVIHEISLPYRLYLPVLVKH